MYLIVTIDTEADGQWSRPRVQTVENLRRLPRFQELCERYGMAPTYLVTYEVAESPLFAEVLRPWEAAGRAEIGSHLHPWTTPPLRSVTGDDAASHPLPCELEDELLRAKLAALTEKITERLGRRPVSYRAGRWGFDVRSAAILRELGYIVDCSVTPGVNWAGHGATGQGVEPDYRGAPVWPYFVDERSVCREGAGAGGLLEVPMTILSADTWVNRRGLVRRAMRRAPDHGPAKTALKLLGLSPLWLRPDRIVGARQMIGVVHTARRMALPCVEMMLHSSEFLPGGSPSFGDEAAVEGLFATLERFFAAMSAEGVEGITLGGFARQWAERARGKVK